MTLLVVAASIIAAGTPFPCTPTRVWDGDGPIWCAEGPKIRLSGIATREVEMRGGRIVDAGCQPSHPCPTVDGVMARDALVRLVGTPVGTARTGHVLVRGITLECVSGGSGRGERTVASCSGPIGDLSCAMVAGGYALRWQAYWGRRSCLRTRD